MDIQGLYAAVFVKELDASSTFYSALIGREPDDKPQATLVQWRKIGSAGIQLFRDAEKAGQGIMTLVVVDLDEEKSALAARGIDVGAVKEGDFGKIAHVSDPDGNVVTLAEPPRR